MVNIGLHICVYSIKRGDSPLLFILSAPRLELGDASASRGDYIYIPPKSSFGKGGLRGVPRSSLIQYKTKNGSTKLPFLFPELNPRLELGTPSLRVKCSTTELIQPEGRRATRFRVQISQLFRKIIHIATENVGFLGSFS